MIDKSFKKLVNEVKGYHLIYLFIFLAAIAIRFFASLNLPINSYEASILLNITNHTQAYPEGISIIQSILIKTSFFVFGESDLAARVWSIMAGSLLVFSPLYLRDRIKTKSALVLSGLITVDPFMIANSIQIGSNIFAIFALVNLFGSIWKKKSLATIFILLFLILSGRGLFFSIVACVALFVFNRDFNLKVKDLFFIWINSWKKITSGRQYLNFCIFGLVMFFLIAFFRIDLSEIFSDFIYSFGSFFGEHFRLNSIFLFPIILFSYIPLLAVSTIMILVVFWKKDKGIFRLIPVWLLFIFIFLSINTYYKSLDLIWISCPLLFLTVFSNQELINNLQIEKKIESIGSLILVICFVSLAITFCTLIYQGVSGFSQNSTFLSLISTIIIIFSLAIFFNFQFGFNHVVKMVINALFVFLFIIQIGISYRSAGLSGSPYNEILWAGIIAEKNSLMEQIELLNQTKKFSTDEIKIGLIKYSEAGILWELRDINVDQYNGSAFPLEKHDILISETEFPMETEYKYYGQKIIENSYPDWTNLPLRNLFYSDYWSWMTMRRSKMAKSFYYMYIFTE